MKTAEEWFKSILFTDDAYKKIVGTSLSLSYYCECGDHDRVLIPLIKAIQEDALQSLNKTVCTITIDKMIDKEWQRVKPSETAQTISKQLFNDDIMLPQNIRKVAELSAQTVLDMTTRNNPFDYNDETVLNK